MTVNWGTGIAAIYIGFAAATSGFVMFAMNRPVSLVSPDYYADSLREDQQLAAIRNTQALDAPPAAQWSELDRIHISLPAAHASVARGSITLYRASDVSADRTFGLTLDARGEQDVSVRGFARGLWLVKLRWSANGREYYFEQPLTFR
jgi:FixH protein